MLKKSTSGQYLYFSLISTLSGIPVEGMSGSVSGRKSTDDISGMIVLSGNIIELGGGSYRANLYDWDCSGSYMGYLFTATGCVPVQYSLVTLGGTSGFVYPASGVNTVVPPVTLSGVVANSGLTISVVKETISGVVANSGLFVTATASVASGEVYLASGSVFRNTFASGVLGASGGFTTAWGNSGQALSASGSFTVVPPAILSGVVANSGLFASVPKETLSGVVANSGLFVTATATLASGEVYLASGSVVGLRSGQFTIPYSGTLSGQEVVAVSGVNAIVPPATLSGVFATVPPATLSGVVANSGLFTSVPIASVSGINAVVPPSTLSGVVGNSGLFVNLPKATISGVVANSGLFVEATATINSGAIVGIASGTISLDSFASGTVSVEIPRYVLVADASGFQSGAAKNSLLGAVLKQTSKFDVASGGSGVATTYETDGVTPFMTQVKTTNTLLKPVQSLDVGQ